MRHRNEVLMKSYGDGILMLRFQAEQTPESITKFTSECGLQATEFVLGFHATEAFLMMEEGHPVTVIEMRNTEDEWDDLVRAVEASGSDGFKARLSNLAASRRVMLSDKSELT